jgi:hypothetical protein
MNFILYFNGRPSVLWGRYFIYGYLSIGGVHEDKTPNFRKGPIFRKDITVLLQ